MEKYKTENISLGGVAFAFEQEAYNQLDRYITNLKQIYRGRPVEGEEIIADIEARIAELILTDKGYANGVVTVEQIMPIIKQLGVPESFEEEETRRVTPPELPKEEPREKIKEEMKNNVMSKRLYRDRDERKIGGVFSGFAAYFDIDVALFRISYFLLLMFTIVLISCDILSGYLAGLLAIFIVSYFLLWIAIPMAKTPRQKLEMRGQRITADTIGEGFRNEMDSRSRNPKNEKTASLFVDVFCIFGRLLRFLMLAFCSFLGVCIALAVMAMIVFSVLVSTGDFGLESLMIYSNYTPLSTTVITFISIVVPLLFFLYLLFVLVFNRESKRWVVFSLIGLWIIAWCVAGTMVAKQRIDLDERQFVINEFQIPVPQDTIYLKPLESRVYKQSDWTLSRKSFDERSGLNIIVDSTLTEPVMLLTQRSGSFGRDEEDAISNAEKVKSGYESSRDTVKINTFLTFDRDNKYRQQTSRQTVRIPKGKVLHVSRAVRKNCYLENGLVCRGDGKGGFYVYGTEPEEKRTKQFQYNNYDEYYY